MRSINIETLMGHSLGLSDSYYRPTEEEILNDYLKAVDVLTINGDIERKGANVASQLEEKDRMIQDMMRKQEQFEQLLQSLIDSGRLKPGWEVDIRRLFRDF
jgi:hypothetical protein